MITRYEKKEISQLWSEEARFLAMLKVELALFEAMEGKLFPVDPSHRQIKNLKINVERINEIEKQTRHDVIAFCTSLTEQLPSSIGKFIHFGITSSDVLDTALSLQIKQSLEVVLPAFKKTLQSLYARAQEWKNVACMGRSHGMEAEPMSFGAKFLGHYAELYRRYLDYLAYQKEELTAQFSGAVGNYAVVDPEVERDAAAKLGLRVEEHSTQVIPRDRLGKLIALGALTASAIERLAVEIRHLHHSDIDELHEGFALGQKGSSTMPHKKNPISAENLTGLARVLRSHFLIASENIVLWHERDISHSSTERLFLPDHFGLLYYSLERLGTTLDKLVIHQDKIESKVKEGTTYLSSYFLHELLLKTPLSREEIYPLVQKAAFKSMETNNQQLFHQTLNQLLAEKDISYRVSELNFERKKEIYMKHTDAIFKRVLRSYPAL